MRSLPGLAEPKPLPKLDVIYQPQGRAREYSDYALNIFEGKCPHECGYCFAEHLPATRRADFDATCRPKRDLLARLERDCERISAAGGWPEENGSVLVSFTCDPLPWGKGDLQDVTYQALGLLDEARVPVALLTKNGSAALDWITWGGHLRGDEFATSIVFAEPQTHLAPYWRWEAHTPSLAERWTALEYARAAGLPTWVSVEPVIDHDEALEVIRLGQSLGVVGHYRIGPLNHHPHARTVDWPRFGEDLARVLTETGARYYLKLDMRRWMPEGFPADNREEE